ncbi:MAG TPA: cation:proton antiporter [Methylomirabilota bacterium]|jgi:Kef-type K+ transport system membrane component KefB|nr:cation:proton antiporter [Methylomirabilota bacterium]
MLYWRPLMDLLTSTSVSIVVAAVLAFLARQLHQPLILGYILAGAVLGPHVGFHVVADEASIELIAEIGLILLLFLIGLEISLPRLLQAGRAITVSGLLQVPICAVLAWLVLGPVVAWTGGPFDRLYLAVASSMSSTLIVVKLLSDKFELGTFGGRVTIGILVFQDLFAIAFLVVQPNLERLDPLLLVRSLVAGAGLLAAAWLLARFVLPAYFRAIAKSSELVVVSAMAWCFLAAGAASWAGLSKEMGALIAGVVIASFPYGPEVVSRIGGVRDFFLTLFFVALGLKIPEPSAAFLLAALGGALFVVLSRFVAMYGLFAALRLDTRTAGVVAINLSQISEFALVIFSLGVGFGHVSPAANSLILYTVLLTAVVSTYGILYNHALATRAAELLVRLGLRRWSGLPAPAAAGEGAAGENGHGATRDLFLLGVSREGLAFVQHLGRTAPAMTARIVAIDFNPEMLERLRGLGIEHHYGDISNMATLEHAGIERAAVVVSGISDWFLKGTSNLQILRAVRALAPAARVVVTADTPEAAQQLYAAGADYVMMPAALAAEHLAVILADRSPNALARARRVQAFELFRR